MAEPTTVADWMLAHYDRDTITDIAQNGCISGCAPDLIYYTDTAAFYDRFSDDIWDTVLNFTQDLDVSFDVTISLWEFDRHGQKRDTRINNHTQFVNAMVWAAVDITAGNILQLKGWD